MPRTYILYLHDILSSAQRIERYVQSLSVEQFTSNSMVSDATLYNLLIIGEAAKHIPDDIRVNYPDVDWRRMAGLRDITAHEYFRLSLEIVWNITQEDIPELKAQIADILAAENDETP